MSLYDKQRKIVVAALNLDPEVNVAKFLPNKPILLSSSDTLTKDQICEAVRAFCLTLNLTTGNSASRDLYLLNEMYLTNPDARDKINHVLTEARKAKYNH